MWWVGLVCGVFGILLGVCLIFVGALYSVCFVVADLWVFGFVGVVGF